MKILIMIPAYNEEGCILELVRTLKAQHPDYDYVVINDCSTDSTRQILRENGLNFLDLPINLGIGGGVQSGYLYALENGYDVAVQMDGDGQHLPEYLPNLIAPIEAGEADAVVGSRFIDNQGFQSSFMRRLGIKILSGLIHMTTGMRIYDVTSGFRAVNRKGIELFSQRYAQDYPEPEALIVSALYGLRTKEVPVVMKERAAGRSSISGFKNIYYMVKVSMAILVAKFTNAGRKKV